MFILHLVGVLSGMPNHTLNRRMALKVLGATGLATAGGIGTVSADGDEAEIKFNDQEAHHNKVVYVEEAKLPEGGFVVVHHMVDNDADTGSEPSGAENFQVIGHTPVLREGEYENLPVRLHDDTHHALHGPVPEEGSGDHVLLAMPHRDTEVESGKFAGGAHDGEYTFTDGDIPYFDEDGNVVATPGVVTF